MSDSKRIFIKTFGCQMNVYDSERIYRMAQKAGYRRADTAEEADLIVVNTCSVRDKPEHKAVSELGWMHKRARAHEGMKIAVAGCVAQQTGEALLDRLPYLDLVVGTGAIERLENLIFRIEQGERVADCRMDPDSSFGMPEHPGGDFHQSKVSAFVSIMRGCNNFCSYCIVPYVRGPERSRPVAKVLAEIQTLAHQGIREVVLLGQNVNSYGANLEQDVDFVHLVERVAKIESICRIRFTTSHPKDLSSRLIDAFARLPKLAAHMHLAVQSGSNHVLSRMNRKYAIEHYMEKVEALRIARPGIAITSDMIVGFCGEEDSDFEASLDLMRSVQFDNLFSFMYSPRPGTEAANMVDDVPLDVKKERLRVLQTLQQAITLEKNRALIGRTLEVLVEGASRGNANQLQGRTEGFRVVHFEDPNVSPGDLVRIRIEQAYQNALVGTRENPVQ